LITSPGYTQYLYLDANGNGIHDSGDRLNASDSTTLEVWIDTAHNRDGSASVCPTSDGAMTLSGYEFILHAVGGTISWGAFTNLRPEMGLIFDSASDSTDYYAGRAGSTFNVSGLYHLGTLVVSIRSGDPRIDVVSATPLNSAYSTAFGSECSGVDWDNALKLGSAWFDADGVAEPPPPPNFAAPLNAFAAAGSYFVLTAAATAFDESLPLSIEASGVPAGLAFSTTDSTSTTKLARIYGTPGSGDIGHHSILWRATEGGSAATIGSTDLEIAESPGGGQGQQPSSIVSIWIGGFGFVDTTSTPRGVDARIGEWDGVFPAPEPEGASELNVEIDVGSGGFLTFSYSVQSWDENWYDWFDMYILAPSESLSVVNGFGPQSYPYPIPVELRRTETRSGTVGLYRWAGQHVRAVFAVTQDGNTDQTAAFVSSIQVSGCRISPLVPLTGSLSQQLEGGYDDETDLTDAMQSAVSCFRTKLAGVGITTFIPTSAYRTPEYQAHFGEVYDKARRLKPFDRNPASPCKSIADSIDAELARHKIGAKPASPSGPHTKRIAIDVSQALLDARPDIDQLANPACLRRPRKVKDRWHFELIGGNCVPCPP
jgi:hypothetical protein